MNLQTHSVSPNFSYKFSFSVNDILKDWSCIHHSNTYLTSGYLKALEDSKLSCLSFIYVVIYNCEVPVGIMYFQCLEINNKFYTQENFPKEIHKMITSILLKNICGNLMICGNIFATGTNGFVLDKNTPNGVVIKVVNSLKSVLEKSEPNFLTSFILFKEFWKNKNIDFQNQLKSYIDFEIDVNMILYLDADWKNFQDYLNNMKTKYRTRAKSVYKKTNEIKEKRLTLEDIKKHQKVIQELYLSVVNTANFNVATFSDESFYLLKKGLQEHFLFTGYFLNNKMIAFSTACFTNNFLDANYVGIDYSINKSIPLYQRILYDYVQLAIKHNVKELRLGRTAETIKSSLGAEPIPMFLYLKHTNKIVNTLLKPFSNNIKPSEYKVRKPFKAKRDI